MKINYYSIEKNEYLSRELGWIWKNLSELDATSLDEQNETIDIFCVGQNPEELERLSRFPHRSIWVLLYADETLNPKINMAVVSHHAVCGVIRHYPYSENTAFFRFRSLIGSIRRSNLSFTEFFSPSFLVSFFSTFVLNRRMHLTYKLHKKFSKVSIHLYLGYTNLFARSIAKLMWQSQSIRVEENDSLLRFAKDSLMHHKRENVFSFTGQQGKFWRERAILEFERWNRAHSSTQIRLRIRNSFSGTEGANGVTEAVGLDYVKELLAAKYVLCPPGNYSIYTFRFLESLASGSVPLYCSPCPSDPTSNYQKLHSLIPLFGSWSETLTNSLSWPEGQRQEYLRELLMGYNLCFEDVNKVLRSLA